MIYVNSVSVSWSPNVEKKSITLKKYDSAFGYETVCPTNATKKCNQIYMKLKIYPTFSKRKVGVFLHIFH